MVSAQNAESLVYFGLCKVPIGEMPRLCLCWGGRYEDTQGQSVRESAGPTQRIRFSTVSLGEGSGGYCPAWQQTPYVPLMFFQTPRVYKQGGDTNWSLKKRCKIDSPELLGIPWAMLTFFAKKRSTKISQEFKLPKYHLVTRCSFTLLRPSPES